MITHPDQKYIDSLLTNNTVILEELYKKFSGKIKWMVLQNNGSETDAGDILQEALLSIYKKAKGGNFILSCPFDAFLYAVCRNKWMKELSKRKRRGVTITDIEEYSTLSEDTFRLSEEVNLHQARKDLLMEKLGELGDSCKQLLHLSWSGKSMEEVADMLKVTYGYARKKKSECMGKLVILVKESSQFTSLNW